MNPALKAAATTWSTVENFFDRLWLDFKWRHDLFKHARIEPFLGYGTPDVFHLKGRVLDDRRVLAPAEEMAFWHNIRHTIRRVGTDEIPGARVRVTYGDLSCEVETDGDGYFDVTLRPERFEPSEGPWHEVALELLAPRPHNPDDVHTVGRVFVPSPDAEYGIISDIDDTVLRTGATNRFTMIKVVLLNNAHSRTPFEGVATFYEALQAGPDDRGHNPLFYLSSSPWNLFDLFIAFMDAHGIPPGPLFLKDFGFTEDKFLKTGHDEHKLAHIDTLLGTYPDLPFILIGDSGQHDPEIYRQAVAAHPGRIRAVFIRDVTPDGRDAEVHALAREVEEMGVPMFLVPHTGAAAGHALRLGLVNPAHTRAVQKDVNVDISEK